MSALGMYNHMMYADVMTSVVAWHTEHTRLEKARRVEGPPWMRLVESSLGEKGPKYAHAKMVQYTRNHVAIHCTAVSTVGTASILCNRCGRPVQTLRTSASLWTSRPQTGDSHSTGG